MKAKNKWVIEWQRINVSAYFFFFIQFLLFGAFIFIILSAKNNRKSEWTHRPDMMDSSKSCRNRGFSSSIFVFLILHICITFSLGRTDFSLKVSTVVRFHCYEMEMVINSGLLNGDWSESAEQRNLMSNVCVNCLRASNVRQKQSQMPKNILLFFFIPRRVDALSRT